MVVILKAYKSQLALDILLLSALIN